MEHTRRAGQSAPEYSLFLKKSLTVIKTHPKLCVFFIFVGQCDLHRIHINYFLSELCQNLWARFWMTFLIGGLHLSHGTSHGSNVFVVVVFLGQSGETIRWRVCFCLVFNVYVKFKGPSNKNWDDTSVKLWYNAP